MNPANPFHAFASQRYLSLETFKKNGEGIRTPVWFAADPADASAAPLIYVYTLANSGKIKRIRNNSQVRIAPCDMRGNVTGEWVDATVTIVTGDEATRGMSWINRKYSFWKRLLDVLAMLRRNERVVLAIRPR